MNKHRSFAWLLAVVALLVMIPAGHMSSTPAISFTDDDGNLIELDKPASRIISLYSGHTEVMYYLGAQDLLLGAHYTSTFPPDAAFLPRYDYTADPETIIAAEPDVVLFRPTIARRYTELVDALRKAGVIIVSLYCDDLTDFDAYLMKMGQLTGSADKAEALLQDFGDKLERISSMTSAFEPKTRAFFESTETELRTVTPQSMPGMAIDMAGGVNVAGDAEPVSDGSSIAAFGAERILELADDIDVYISQRGAMNAGGDEHAISIRPGFSAIKAVAEGRILLINEKLISSPSLRYPIGVMELARAFYPDRMDDLTPYTGEDPATRRDLARIVFRARHLPIFIPSSSRYYETEQTGHVYGLFTDIVWTDPDFDAIETVVQSGFVGYDGDAFQPDAPVTRDDLAKTVFVIGSFAATDTHININDIDSSAHARIVQTLTDNGVFTLEDGNFNPARTVTRDEIIDALSYIDR